MKDRHILNEFENLKGFKVFNVDQEWEHFMNQVEQSATTPESDIPSHHTLTASNNTSEARVFRLPRYVPAIAASLLLLLISTLVFFKSSDQALEPVFVQEPTIEIEEPENVEEIVELKKPVVKKVEKPKSTFNSYASTDVINLEDGSVIQMLTASVLKYPKNFKNLNERVVHFKSGSATFDVVEDSKRPFRVITDNSGISVIGTTFTIVKKGEETSIKTLEGTVQLYSLKNPTVKQTITVGEEFSFDGQKIVEVAQLEPEIKPEVVDTRRFPLNRIQKLWKENMKDFVDIKKTAIEKSIREDILTIPADYVNFGKPENIIKLIRELELNYNVDYVKGDCEHCYKINSITPK